MYIYLCIIILALSNSTQILYYYYKYLDQMKTVPAEIQDDDSEPPLKKENWMQPVPPSQNDQLFNQI